MSGPVLRLRHATGRPSSAANAGCRSGACRLPLASFHRRPLVGQRRRANCGARRLGNREAVMTYTLKDLRRSSRAANVGAADWRAGCPRSPRSSRPCSATLSSVAESFSDDTRVGSGLHHDRRHRRLRAGACLQGSEKRLAAQPRRVMGGVWHRARGYRDDRVATDRSESEEQAGSSRWRLASEPATPRLRPGVLHSTRPTGKASVIRVTGADLDAVPRFRSGRPTRSSRRSGRSPIYFFSIS